MTPAWKDREEVVEKPSERIMLLFLREARTTSVLSGPAANRLIAQIVMHTFPYILKLFSIPFPCIAFSRGKRY